jgi:DNA polymerase-3 subunit epsilon
MRQVVLDTETTGLEPSEGHRIIEIGCIELNDRRITERSFHCYLNPDRDVEGGALAVHGLDNGFLADKPRFAEVVDELIDFISGAELIIHNAPFDVGFLDAEIERLQRPDAPRIAALADVLDTVVLARSLHPGQRVSLDALCKRYDVDHSGRQLHGALLDAELLAQVYLAMTGGQVDLGLGEANAEGRGGQVADLAVLDLSALVHQRPSAAEQAAHQARLTAIEAQSGQCLWLTQQRS